MSLATAVMLSDACQGKRKSVELVEVFLTDKYPTSFLAMVLIEDRSKLCRCCSQHPEYDKL